MSLTEWGYDGRNPRELGEGDFKTLTDEEFRNYYFSEDYEIYFIEYSGDIFTAISKVDYADVYITDKFFAILFVKNGMLNTLLERVPEIISLQPNAIYTLSELKVDGDTSNGVNAYENQIPLTGEDIIVGIIGTGMDYLNPRFINENGESRIVSIWDQTIEKGPSPSFYPYGTVYNKEDIDNAIRISKNTTGNSPYDIVAHKDEVGHGTAIAGIIGGRLIGEVDRINSIVPKCQFAVVKLTEAKKNILTTAGIVKDVNNVYQSSDITAAIRYLSELQESLNKPMVVYLSIGSNFGGRNGDTITERYIDNLTNRRDFFIVTETGNQGTGSTHTSGSVVKDGTTSDILINVGKLQTLLNITIYFRSQDVISITITSPSGNTLSNIPLTTNIEQLRYFSLEENNISIDYITRTTISGYLSLNILIKNTTEGVWNIRLTGVDIINGVYNAWMPQSELLEGDTRFLRPDPSITLLTPCGASNIVATSNYNQINNTIVESSGKGFPIRTTLEPTVTNAGVNLLTAGLNNSLIIGTGGAMAGAVLTGAVALISQWGVSNESLMGFYAPQVRNIIINSTVKEEGKLYPNIEWGFGKFSFNLLHGVLERIGGAIETRKLIESNGENQYSYLYINIPSEIFQRIKS
ncbi:subtilisin family serine protease [Clostridium punense]|uniref:Subtilisin family serine protease n=1 Tax=Clostridium punense TaxID=1054297 RepID=A0ABS4K599_9CLOT|nr:MULTISPECIES: S8 family peptidase [Clostridium]MBP2022955.1 subtilisin family serine protease [Clostridium punense]